MFAFKWRSLVRIANNQFRFNSSVSTRRPKMSWPRQKEREGERKSNPATAIRTGSTANWVLMVRLPAADASKFPVQNYGTDRQRGRGREREGKEGKRERHTNTHRHTDRHWQAEWPHLKVKSYILEKCSNPADIPSPTQARAQTQSQYPHSLPDQRWYMRLAQVAAGWQHARRHFSTYKLSDFILMIN